ncbi:MAG: hypothetical protein LC749_06025, partial [Actinobacteria bacterium]|nr:hypothetical protein [Actinomycetota bacterium]
MIDHRPGGTTPIRSTLPSEGGVISGMRVAAITRLHAGTADGMAAALSAELLELVAAWVPGPSLTVSITARAGGVIHTDLVVWAPSVAAARVRADEAHRVLGGDRGVILAPLTVGDLRALQAPRASGAVTLLPALRTPGRRAIGFATGGLEPNPMQAILAAGARPGATIRMLAAMQESPPPAQVRISAWPLAPTAEVVDALRASVPDAPTAAHALAQAGAPLALRVCLIGNVGAQVAAAIGASIGATRGRPACAQWRPGGEAAVTGALGAGGVFRLPATDQPYLAGIEVRPSPPAPRRHTGH